MVASLMAARSAVPHRFSLFCCVQVWGWTHRLVPVAKPLRAQMRSFACVPLTFGTKCSCNHPRAHPLFIYLKHCHFVIMFQKVNIILTTRFQILLLSNPVLKVLCKLYVNFSNPQWNESSSVLSITLLTEHEKTGLLLEDIKIIKNAFMEIIRVTAAV